MSFYRRVGLVILSVALAGSVWAARIDPSLAQREKMARDTRQTISYLENYHYLRLKIADISSEDIIRQAISDLDYHR
jgi:hypothetical protein